MAGEDGESISVLPFCGCFLEGEGAEVQKSIGPFLGWLTGEYDVLDSERVYVEVAGHRARCRLQPDLLERRSTPPSPPSARADAAEQALAEIVRRVDSIGCSCQRVNANAAHSDWCGLILAAYIRNHASALVARADAEGA